MAVDPDWDLLRSFLAVARLGSLSAAARDLGTTQPTVGRHVDALERQLGMSLFTRSPGGLIATEAAADLLPHARAMEAAAGALMRAATGAAGGGRGTVRIAAGIIVGAHVLPPLLRELREAYPGIVLELALSNRSEDLLRRDADIAVRMVRPVQDALLARQLGVVTIGLFATQDYVARHGVPAGLTDLDRHTLVGFDRDDFAARGASLGPVTVTRELFQVRCDNDLAILAALRAGVGIGACQHGLARSWGLVPVLPDAVAFTLEVWLAMHEDLRAHRPVRLVYDHLASRLPDLLLDPA
jgi:DNA-binding transcriptional LysR family regulator